MSPFPRNLPAKRLLLSVVGSRGQLHANNSNILVHGRTRSSDNRARLVREFVGISNTSNNMDLKSNHREANLHMRVFLCPGICLYQAVAQASCMACLHAVRPAWSPVLAQSCSTVFCMSAPFERTESPWKGPKRLLFCRYPDVKLPVNGAVKFHWTELHGVWRTSVGPALPHSLPATTLRNWPRPAPVVASPPLLWLQAPTGTPARCAPYNVTLMGRLHEPIQRLRTWTAVTSGPTPSSEALCLHCCSWMYRDGCQHEDSTVSGTFGVVSRKTACNRGGGVPCTYFIILKNAVCTTGCAPLGSSQTQMTGPMALQVGPRKSRGADADMDLHSTGV